MKALHPGDAVVVTKLDRIARSSRDLHNILGKLKDLGCGFVTRRRMVRHHQQRRAAGDLHHGRHCRVRARTNPRSLPGWHRPSEAKGTRFGCRPVLDAGKRKVLAERYAAGETMAKLALEYERRGDDLASIAGIGVSTTSAAVFICFVP
jgi:hypothetical protein